MAHVLDSVSGQRASTAGRDAVFRYDAEVDALYYRLTNEPVVRTVNIGDRVLVDVDAAGQAIGIEVLNPPGFSMTLSAETTGATSCQPSREGGMCGCGEDDDGPGDCLQARCDC
jgi:uncharacterized protein YuzE